MQTSSYPRSKTHSGWESGVLGEPAQGIGWALSETAVVWRNGRMINNQMTNYIMPTAVDLPTIKVLFHESPYAGGPQGLKVWANCPSTVRHRRFSTLSRMRSGSNSTRSRPPPEVIFSDYGATAMLLNVNGSPSGGGRTYGTTARRAARQARLHRT